MFRRVQRGDPVPVGFADEMRRLAKSVEVHVLPPLTVDPTTGTIMLEGDDDPGPRFVRIDSAATADARYSWVEQVPDPATGAPTDGGRTGTTTRDPAIEINGNTSVAINLRVETWRDAAGRLRFRSSNC